MAGFDVVGFFTDVFSVASSVSDTVSSVSSAVDSIRQSNALKKSYEYNAKVMEQNAKVTAQNAEYNRQQRLKALRKTIGAQTAAFGASGVSSGTGSALDIAMDTTMQGDLEAAFIDYSGRVESNSYLAQANSYRNAASVARKQGLLTAGTTILGTAAKLGLGATNYFNNRIITDPFGTGPMSGGFNLNSFGSDMIA